MTSFSGMVELHRRLIHLRRNWDNNTRGLRGGNVNVFHVNPEGVIAFHRWDQGGPGDDVVVVANLSNRRWDSYNVGFPREGTWYLRFNSDCQGYAPEFTNVGYDTTAAHRRTAGHAGQRKRRSRAVQRDCSVPVSASKRYFEANEMCRPSSCRSLLSRP